LNVPEASIMVKEVWCSVDVTVRRRQKNNDIQDASYIIKASSKRTKITQKVVKSNNKSLPKWSMAAVKKTGGVTKKKKSSDGCLIHI
jgi:hypothetical protein